MGPRGLPLALIRSCWPFFCSGVDLPLLFVIVVVNVYRKGLPFCTFALRFWWGSLSPLVYLFYCCCLGSVHFLLYSPLLLLYTPGVEVCLIQ
jgi:hypothetical protein